MRVLLVSDQSIRIDGSRILGSEHFTKNVSRMCVLGEMHLCVTDAGNSNLHLFDDDISGFVAKENVKIISKSQIFPSLPTIGILYTEISKVDLVLIYLPSVNAEIAALISKLLGKRYMTIMIACTWDGLRSQDWKRKIAAPYRFYLNKKVVRNADYASYVTHKFFQSRYPSDARISLGLSDVVLNGVDQSVLDDRLKRIERKNDSDTIRIATTGAVNAIYKGQRYVIDAIKKLQDMGYDNYEYCLIGGGDTTGLRLYAKSLNIEDKIKFYGAVSHETVFNLLKDIDIYIQPSLTEGLPRSVVEAMSMGVPCIGSAVGAIPELLDSGYVVQRKSSSDIVSCLMRMRDKRVLRSQATRNFEESKKYECDKLDAIREDFYTSVKKDVLSFND